ncbi:MAG: hypothetical protein IKR04_03225 [Clostridia bacterium]|nr:hypothetical protein [Clostridia bacterium]
MDEDKLFVKDDNGDVKEFSLLSVVNLNGKDDDFAVYTDYSLNANNEINIFSGIMGQDGFIKKVEDQNDIQALNSYISSLNDDIIL